jgi:Zn-dependent protease
MDNETQKPSLKKRILKWGLIGLLIVKVAKWIPLALKFAGKGKSLLSMILMVGVYAMYFGWPFAVGFVLLLFLHEYGHVLVLRHYGIKAGAPVFIPFVGAVIAMKEMPRNAWQEAFVGAGGPLLGSLAALAVLCLSWALDSQLLQALAYVGFLLNLFNMIPVTPMDGGRIVGAVSKWFLVAGFVVGGVIFAFTLIPILGLILLIGLAEVIRVFKHPVKGYYEIPKANRVFVGVCYVVLTGLLVVAVEATLIPESELGTVRVAALNLVPVFHALTQRR